MEPINPLLVKRYENILVEDPKSKIFCPLAQIYILKKDLKKAEEVCLKGIEHNPNYAKGHITLAKIYVEQKKWDEALKTVGYAKNISPDSHQIYQILASIYTEKKDLEKTLAAHKMLIFMRPWDKETSKTIHHLEKILSLQKDQNLQPSLNQKIDQIDSSKNRKSVEQIKALQKLLAHIDHLISKDTLKEQDNAQR